VIGSLVHLGRNLRAGFVLAREGALSLVDPAALPPSGRILLRLARVVERPGADREGRLAAALTRLGPSYVKFGQFLATRPDLIGMAAARDLESLQDRMAPFPQAVARRVVEAELGRPIDELFVTFGEPMAAASIAQVHRATIRTLDGERDVAVKVVRPGVRGRFNRDLQALRFAARMAEWIVPDTRRLRLVGVVETLARSVTMEMDLRLEAAAMSEFAENTKDDPDFRVPTLEWDLTSRDVLTSEWIDGVKLNRLEAIDAAGVDRVALSRTVIQSFLRHAIRDGFFHADMHPETCSWTIKGALSPWISASRAGSGSRNAASSPRSSSASSGATTAAWRRCTSRRATCRPTIPWTTSPRPSAPSASRSTSGAPTRSPWRGSSPSCSR
jgi:ubiquinone biosynthesis protein